MAEITQESIAQAAAIETARHPSREVLNIRVTDSEGQRHRLQIERSTGNVYPADAVRQNGAFIGESLANINGAPNIKANATANINVAPTYRGDPQIVSEIQRYAIFAKAGGLESLQDIALSGIDGKSGGRTGASMMAMTGQRVSELKDMSQAEYADSLDAKMKSDPAFRTAVIAGLSAADADPQQVAAFLEDQGVESLDSYIAGLDETAPVAEIQSSDPRELQGLLGAIGQTPDGGIDGVIGGGTRAALTAEGLDPTSPVSENIETLRTRVRDTMTLDSLNTLAENADTPGLVTTLQSILRALGFDIDLDGKMGPETSAAIDSARQVLEAQEAAPEPEVAPEGEIENTPTAETEFMPTALGFNIVGPVTTFQIIGIGDVGQQRVMNSLSVMDLQNPAEHPAEITAMLDGVAALGDEPFSAVMGYISSLSITEIQAIQDAYTGGTHGPVNTVLNDIIDQNREMMAASPESTPDTAPAPSPIEISSVFESKTGEALMFVVNDDGTINLAHQDGSDAKQTVTTAGRGGSTKKWGDFDAMVRDEPDTIRVGLKAAIEHHLGLDAHYGFEQAKFDALMDNTNGYGFFDSQDTIPEFVREVLNDIKAEHPGFTTAAEAQAAVDPKLTTPAAEPEPAPVASPSSSTPS